MPKSTHKEVKFSEKEMNFDLPDEIDFSKVIHLGRGPEAIRTAMAISQIRRDAVRLDPDVASVFKDSVAVNKALRALIQAMPGTEAKRSRKSA